MTTPSIPLSDLDWLEAKVRERLHAEVIGNSENLSGPFPCVCSLCRENQTLLKVIAQARTVADLTARLAPLERMLLSNAGLLELQRRAGKAEADLALARQALDAFAASLDRPPQGWPTCATCKWWRKTQTSKCNGECANAKTSVWICESYFGCALHEPLAPAPSGETA